MQMLERRISDLETKGKEDESGDWVIELVAPGANGPRVTGRLLLDVKTGETHRLPGDIEPGEG